jgi:methionyl-tRNA formyltransferase
MRIVTLNAYPTGYQLVHDFAERNGHEIVLVVTLPHSSRYGDAVRPMILDLPERTDVLVTTKLRTVAAPVIAALRPDVIISAAFPRLIPAEILELPKYGAINCHPSPLPTGRGPTPQRLIYEGDDRVGATVHRTAAEFDTGAILAQRIAPLPEDLNGDGIMNTWRTLLTECLDEAVPRLVAGDPGTPQDPALATEAPFFTEAEHFLDLTEPAAVIRRKAAALNVTSPTAKLRLNGTTHTITRTDPKVPPPQEQSSQPTTTAAPSKPPTTPSA